ncbi:hypothetical protein [Paenibacillus flagellatus]|uniref:ECF transporter S component n=1 Tax=Paenibacillus flagellatus TaxID=2211139 RepID=A0A2V5KA45_9BACL|nr:hypothetical protein [Paenibacillus flagellatus]PYI56298.1 hypothetical protein DLM86_04755 [Paenibacillus flagellatus]
MLKGWLHYWGRPLPVDVSPAEGKPGAGDQTKRLVTVALLGALSALLQSAGGLLPGPGFLISPLATAPVVLASAVSIRSGLGSFLTALVLLVIVQPSELIVFPFTTGLLGIALGYGIHRFGNRAKVVTFAACALAIGIVLLVYGLRFPILGPSVATDFRISAVVAIVLFSWVYSAIWLEASLRLMSKIKKSI